LYPVYAFPDTQEIQLTITSMTELLGQALKRGYAIGYFESWDQHSLEAALEAAEEARAPTILGFGAAVTNQGWLERGGIEDLACLARRLAERGSVPAAVLFNEGRTLAQVQRALDAGCNAVMLDNSAQPYAQRVALTQEVVLLARRYGAAVEAELDQLPDATDPHAVALRYSEESRGAARDASEYLSMTIPANAPHASGACLTDPLQARRFVEATGVDALAVAIGNTHLLLNGVAHVDLELLAAIHAAVPAPLVLHGGTGFPAEAVPAAIRCGVAKFNVGTRLKAAFLEGLRQALPEPGPVHNIHPFVGSRDEKDVVRRGMAAMKAEIVRLMRLYGCAGEATPAAGVV